MKSSAFMILSSALFLMGCQSPPEIEVRTTAFYPPEPLLSCSPAPDAPPKPRSQRAIALYLLTLREAYADCAAKIAAIEEWVILSQREEAKGKSKGGKIPIIP